MGEDSVNVIEFKFNPQFLREGNFCSRERGIRCQARRERRERERKETEEMRMRSEKE